MTPDRYRPTRWVGSREIGWACPHGCQGVVGDVEGHERWHGAQAGATVAAVRAGLTAAFEELGAMRRTLEDLGRQLAALELEQQSSPIPAHEAIRYAEEQLRIGVAGGHKRSRIRLEQALIEAARPATSTSWTVTATQARLAGQAVRDVIANPTPAIHQTGNVEADAAAWDERVGRAAAAALAVVVVP